MARFIIARAATIPAGTAIASPATTDISIGEYQVEHITVTIPPGPLGQVGFRLANAGVQMIPYESNNWIIGNDRVIEWAMSNQITSGSWQVIAYNTGVFPHTLYFEFLVSPLTDQAAAAASGPLDLSGLGAPATAAPGDAFAGDQASPPAEVPSAGAPPAPGVTVPPPIAPAPVG